MANRDAILAKRREYALANRAILQEKQRLYRAKHPELTRASSRRSYERNKEARLAAQKQYNATPVAKEKKKSNHLKKLYGITLNEYELMYADQKGLCAICGQKERDERRPYLSVDHDHVTGEVRGLLCINCNSALGLLGEDKERARALILYIERHECRD